MSKKLNIKKLLRQTQKWSGLKNLDLAQKVSAKEPIWKVLKRGKKKQVCKK